MTHLAVPGKSLLRGPHRFLLAVIRRVAQEDGVVRPTSLALFFEQSSIAAEVSGNPRAKGSLTARSLGSTGRNSADANADVLRDGECQTLVANI